MKNNYYVLATSRARAHQILVNYIRSGDGHHFIRSSEDLARKAKREYADAGMDFDVWHLVTETKIKSSGNLDA